MKNKVQFGLNNVHLAKLTETNGVITYGTPFAVPGAVKLSVSKEGATVIFRADNKDFYKKAINSGYKGNLEIADVPENVLTQIFGQAVDNNGAILENSEDVIARFALMCEIDGDANKRRIVFYDCLAERPSLEYETTDKEDVKVKTATMDLTISPRSTDNNVKNIIEPTTENQAVYDTFFTQVYEKNATASV